MNFPKDTLVIFSPLPPVENGIADYVAEQLPFHSKCFTVVVVIENSAPEPQGLPLNVCVLRLAEYLEKKSLLAQFPHIYHVGNNPDHGYLLPTLYNVPGVVVVHDLGLHHLVDTQTLVKGKKQAYAWALWQQYGQLGKLLGKQFLEYGWKGQLMPQEARLNGAIIDAAQHIIVHSNYSAEQIRSEFPEKPVTVIPHHLSPVMRLHNRARRPEARKGLSLPAKGVVITSLGFINRAKQIEPVLAALADLKAEGLSFQYILAGKCRRDEYDVFEEIARFGLEDRVWVTGYLDEKAFFQHLVATDLVINLRYPSGGETSGTMIRALGMGRCCVVVDIGPFAEIPNECAVKLQWGEGVINSLREKLRDLIESPAKRNCFENAARDWITATHNIQRTTDVYHEVIKSVATQSAPVTVLGIMGARAFEFPDGRTIESWLMKHSALLQNEISAGAGHLWWREGFLPWPNGQKLSVVAENTTPVLNVLQTILGYADSEIEVFGISDLKDSPLGPTVYRCWARALVSLRYEDVVSDPLFWLAALNWRLEIGAEMVLWLAIDGIRVDKVLQSLSVWQDYFEASGFEVLACCESPSNVTFSEIIARNIEPTFRVRKLCERIERVPRTLQAQAGRRYLVLPALGNELPPLIVKEES